jgi:C1A family cysteine protease
MNIYKKLTGLLLLAVLLFSCSAPDFTGDITGNTNFESYPLGALPEDESRVAARGEYRSFVRGDSLPSSVDLSDGMPVVKNQGSQGSCVGWATGYALKSFQEKLEEGWDLTGTDTQFSPGWVYNQINFGYDSGAFVSDALDLIVEKGCDTWENFPYDVDDCLTQPDAASFARAARYKAISWDYIARDVDEVKAVLASGQAVAFRTDIYQDFYNISDEDPVYDVVEGNRKGGHAMCLVGYDDNLRAFKFINSWGSYWGIDGYGYISYDFCVDNSEVGFRAYVLTDGPNTDPAQKTIHYYSENNEANLHYQKDDGTWSTAPGVAMTSEGSNWFVLTVADSGEMRFCFNDNNGTWDSRSMQDYITSYGEAWIKDEVIYRDKPVPELYNADFSFKSSESGNGVRYVSINIKKQGESSYIFSGSSDEDGHITVPDLEDGTYVIEAYSGNYVFGSGNGEHSWIFSIDGGDYSSILSMTYKGGIIGIYFSLSGAPGYGSPLPGMDVTIEKDGSVYDTVQISTAEHGQPWLGVRDLYSGTYIFKLDQVDDGYRYTGTVSASVSESEGSDDVWMTVTREEWTITGKTIHYYNDSYSQAYIHYRQDSGSWTNAPGTAMTSEGDNWFIIEIEDEQSLEFCFNNGSGSWDSNNGSNYNTESDEIWVKNGSVYTEYPNSTTTFFCSANSVPQGYWIEVRGSKAPLSWASGIKLENGSGTTRSGSFEIDGSFEYKYTLVNAQGSVIWEQYTGNRNGQSGSTYQDNAWF